MQVKRKTIIRGADEKLWKENSKSTNMQKRSLNLWISITTVFERISFLLHTNIIFDSFMEWSCKMNIDITIDSRDKGGDAELLEPPLKEQAFCAPKRMTIRNDSKLRGDCFVKWEIRKAWNAMMRHFQDIGTKISTKLFHKGQTGLILLICSQEYTIRANSEPRDQTYVIEPTFAGHRITRTIISIMNR